MKKFIRTLLAISMMAILTSCGSAEPASNKNMVALAELTPEQQEIIDLLSVPDNQELMIFDFNTEEAYHNMEIWVEVYRNGELIEQPSGVSQHSDLAEKQNGHFVVVINHDDSKYQWSLSVIADGGKTNHVGTYEMTDNPGYGRAFGPVNAPASIEEGKEIILYTSLFNEATAPMRTYDRQTLQEQPELLEEYPLAFLIKCKFSQDIN